MMSFLPKKLALIVLSASPVLTVLAQDVPSTTNAVRLDPVTVTANRTEQKLSQTGKVVTVLPDSVLQRFATQTVAELLTRQSGLMIVGAQGTLGTNQDVYLRGAGSANTLILLDGQPVYDPSGAAPTFDLNLITVGECERIEILKGAQSTIYGSDAVAGVINIFTRSGSSGKKPLGATLTANYGSYNTFRGTLGIHGSTDRVYYNAQFTRQQSTGFSTAYDAENTGKFDKDGYDQNAVLANVGVHLTSALTLKFRLLHSNYTTDLDAGAFADDKNFTFRNKFTLFGTGLTYRYNKGLLTVNYSLSDSRRTYLDDSTQVEPGTTASYSFQKYGGLAHYAEIYNTLKISNFIDLLTGADYRFSNTDQTYRSITQYGLYEAPPIGADTARTGQLSFYASGFLRTKFGLFAELGGRYNRNSLYGNTFTYSFNPSYLVKDRLKLFVNLSSGFRAPSLYQLFSAYGNKALQPEKSHSAEVGVQLFSANKQSYIRALYFDRTIRNVIFFQSLSVPPYTSQYINFDKQHDWGWELEGQATWRKWSLTGNLTLLDGQVTTQNAGRDTTYNNLFRRPKTLLNVTVGYQVLPNLFVSASWRSVGDRVDRFFNDETFGTENVTLAAYSTVDLYADYQISRRFRVYADVRNLTDQTYYDVYGYTTRRRNATVGLRVNF